MNILGEKGGIIKLTGIISLYIIAQNTMIIPDTIIYHYTNLTITLHRGESKTLQRGKVTASVWMDKPVTVMSTNTQPTATTGTGHGLLFLVQRP